MTREEAIDIINSCVQADFEDVNIALDMAIKALEQEPKTEQFAKWVAEEIFDEMWEYNKDAFAEIACRKLAKLGIVREKGDEWELVEPQETETWNGIHAQITAPKGTFDKIWENAESGDKE